MSGKQEIRFSRRLNDADAKFFFLGRRSNCNVAMVMLAMLSRGLSRDELIETLLPFKEEIPRFGDYLRPAPLNIAPPMWIPVPDADADPERYIHTKHLPRGAGWGAVFAEVDALQSAPFLPERAPWEVVLLNGLPGDRAVMVLKVHHTFADGMALAILFAKALAADLLADAGVEIEVASEPVPSASRLRLALADRRATYQNWLARLREVAPGLREREWWRAEAGALKKFLRPPQRWPTTSHRRTRRLTGFRVPTEIWREVASSRGGGVNDLYLALVAWIMRRAFVSADFDREPLRVAMPIGMRGDQAVQTGHNIAAVGIVELTGRAMDLSDLTATRERAQTAKETAETATPTLCEGALDLLPGPLRAAIEFRLASSCDVLATSIPIPMEGKLDGNPIEMMFMVAPAIGQAVSFSLTGYGEHLYLAANADCGLAPADLDQFIEETLDEVLGDAVEPLASCGIGPSVGFGERRGLESAQLA